MKLQAQAWNDKAFVDQSEGGLWYQCRVLAMMTFIQPTIEDELIAHTMGVRLLEAK